MSRLTPIASSQQPIERDRAVLVEGAHWGLGIRVLIPSLSLGGGMVIVVSSLSVPSFIVKVILAGIKNNIFPGVFRCNLNAFL